MLEARQYATQCGICSAPRKRGRETASAGGPVHDVVEHRCQEMVGELEEVVELLFFHPHRDAPGNGLKARAAGPSKFQKRELLGDRVSSTMTSFVDNDHP